MEESSSSFAIPINEDYESEFEYDADVGEKRKARQDLTVEPTTSKAFKPNKQVFQDECAREQGRIRQQAYLSLDAYTRHKKLINDYVLCYRGATDKLKRNKSNYKTDHDVIRENHRFLWEDEDDARTWGEQLAKKYYDRLFKEYCLCDLTRYRDKKIGMRWRTQKEVILGKGQFFCGNIHCEKEKGLISWEVLFSYYEHGVKKSALVKLRLCVKCSSKLHQGYKGKSALKRWQNKNCNKIQENLEVEPNDPTINSEQHVEKATCSDSHEEEIWKQPVTEEVEQSKEDAFEEFLEDLFL